MLHTNNNVSPAAAVQACASPPPGAGRVSLALASTLRDMRAVLAAQLRRNGAVPCGVATEHAAEIVLLGHVMAIAHERDPDELPDLLDAARSGDWRCPDTAGLADAW